MAVRIIVACWICGTVAFGWQVLSTALEIVPALAR
jgi:hypothetical protein